MVYAPGSPLPPLKSSISGTSFTRMESGTSSGFARGGLGRAEKRCENGCSGTGTHAFSHFAPLSWAREAPFQTFHSVSRFLRLSITWGICSSLDGQPQSLAFLALVLVLSACNNCGSDRGVPRVPAIRLRPRVGSTFFDTNVL